MIRLLRPGVGEADDRLAVEQLADQIAEERRVDERSGVFELAAGADDRGLSEGLDPVHPAERLREPGGEELRQHGPDPALLRGEIGERRSVDPWIAQDRGHAGTLRGAIRSPSRLGHHGVSVRHELTKSDPLSRGISITLLHGRDRRYPYRCGQGRSVDFELRVRGVERRKLCVAALNWAFSGVAAGWTYKSLHDP